MQRNLPETDPNKEAIQQDAMPENSPNKEAIQQDATLDSAGNEAQTEMTSFAPQEFFGVAKLV